MPPSPQHAPQASVVSELCLSIAKLRGQVSALAGQVQALKCKVLDLEAGIVPALKRRPK